MTPAGGEPYDVVVGGPGELLEHNGLELAFRDTPPPAGRPGGWRWRARLRPERPAGPSADAARGAAPCRSRPARTGPAPSHRAPSAPKDEWL